MGKLLSDESGRQVVNALVPSVKQLIKKYGTTQAGVQLSLIEENVLPNARAEVLRALEDGQAVEITVEAKTLWKTSGPFGMHVVLLTGAVLDRDGGVVGYYINDSGSGEFGKFVARRDFERAWLNDDLQRVYIK
jgi:hypothetical protein